MIQFHEKIRKYCFWTLDILKGGNVYRHMRELEKNQKKIQNSKDLKSFQENKLRKIIRHALNTCSFYSDRTSKRVSIIDLPIVNKSIIREDFDKFISNLFAKDQLHEVVTSGSTGLPFKVLHDANKVDSNTADTIFFAKKAGFKLGQPLAYLKIWNDFNEKSLFTQWMQNIIPVDVMNLSDTYIQNIINKLGSRKPAIGILGYASSIEEIAKYINNDGIRISLQVSSLISMSEALSQRAKIEIEKAFNCKIVSRYSNVENGLIAQQFLDDTEYFYINSTNYYVEILKMDSNQLAPDGELGRILVTDFNNYGMPMLRYDTGDIGIKDSVETSTGIKEVFRKVEGRKMDAIYNTKGDLLSSFVITNGMWNYSELLQYQFIQRGSKEYTFKLNIDCYFTRENELINEFKSYLGLDAKINIEYVDEIPVLSSGKRRKVINSCNF